MNIDTCIGCPSYKDFLMFNTTCRLLRAPDRFFNPQYLIINCPCKDCIVKATCLKFCTVYDKHCDNGLTGEWLIHNVRI
jgi:hypothetical protein